MNLKSARREGECRSLDVKLNVCDTAASSAEEMGVVMTGIIPSRAMVPANIDAADNARCREEFQGVVDRSPRQCWLLWEQSVINLVNGRVRTVLHQEAQNQQSLRRRLDTVGG